MGFNNYIDETNMIGLGIRCDNCGRTTKGATYVNGMYFCAKCYQDTFGSKIVNVTIDNKSIPEISKETNIDTLEQENKVLKKALELAIESWCNMDNPDEPADVYKYFIEQAKESLNEQV